MDNFIFNLSNLYEDKGDLGSNEIHGIHISQSFSLICEHLFTNQEKHSPLLLWLSCRIQFNLVAIVDLQILLKL